MASCLKEDCLNAAKPTKPLNIFNSSFKFAFFQHPFHIKYALIFLKLKKDSKFYKIQRIWIFFLEISRKRRSGTSGNAVEKALASLRVNLKKISPCHPGMVCSFMVRTLKILFHYWDRGKWNEKKQKIEQTP